MDDGASAMPLEQPIGILKLELLLGLTGAEAVSAAGGADNAIAGA
jgi:hypothetical protein